MLGWFMGASTLMPFIIGIIYRYYKDKPVSEFNLFFYFNVKSC